MDYRRSVIFVVLFAVGWFIAAVFFSIVIRGFTIAEEMSRGELWIVGICVHALAAMAGFSFARARTPRSQLRGFEVITRPRAADQNEERHQ